jgi:hypothetical protein
LGHDVRRGAETARLRGLHGNSCEACFWPGDARRVLRW